MKEGGDKEDMMNIVKEEMKNMYIIMLY